ncbi:interleukin-23 receptor [Cheilinus undulatus]|uniref:interleukin-23 receptor n=1 Tax=Cheilinus undulatus TaxID=241271 RepID=UPI001BD526D3|nr:interleukin-23 receptor [Cheilinus undulatus]
MNLYSIIWKYIIILFSVSIKYFPLQPANCVIFNGLGTLKVEPAPPFLLSSNLTVYCHIKKCWHRSKIFLKHSGEILAPSQRINCTAAMFNLFNIQVPKSSLVCKLEFEDKVKNVNVLDLHGGYPPDKPENVICETTRSSNSIDCSWFRGKETYLKTAYNVSIRRVNGTPEVFVQNKSADVVSIPKAQIDENTTYHLIVTAYNYLGASQSDPFILCMKDIVIPETPQIMQIEFLNNSIAAILRWKTAESSGPLQSWVRLRTETNSWEAGERSEPSEGLIKVEGLKPLTNYEFKMRACFSISCQKHSNMTCFTTPSASSKRPYCSKWSPSVRGRSPGKGPSQQLHVWRILGYKRKDGEQMVTVLWKHPNPEDYSGEVQQFMIFLGNDQKQSMTCAAALSQCSVPLSAQVQSLRISAVTLYGTSPPSDVPLKQSGNIGPLLRKPTPAADGSAVFVSWSRPENKHMSLSGENLLYYVLEWTSVPVAALQWQKVDKEENATTITGLTAGVRYNISVFAVASRGVSAPSTHLVYSKEEEPCLGPTFSVLVHEATRILIEWDELPVDQQRGFITHYTIYLQTLDSSDTELKVTVSGSSLRQKWLDCPDGALTLQMTASTSAGEGPRGSRVSSQPTTPAVGLLIVTFFIMTLFIGIIANLLCWSCVRERIKQKCISCGPAWVGENLPKPGNSFAIRLLQNDRSEPPFSITCSDPPLSPVTLISQEESDDVYPNVHIEFSQDRLGQPTVKMPLLSDPEAMLVDSQPEHVSYKPQISIVAPQAEEVRITEEDHGDAQESVQEDRNSCMPGGLLGGLFSHLEVDFSVSPVALTLSTVSDLLWPETQETTSVINGGFMLERREENDVEVDLACQNLEQGEIRIQEPANPCLSLYGAETSQTTGYFPQLAAVNTITVSDSQR